MRKWLVMVTALLLSAAAHAAEVSGIELPDQVQVESTPLQLNGAGVRKKFFFSVNVVGLYLPEARRTTAEVLALPGPKRVTLVMLRDVSAEQFIDALRDGLNNNTPAEDLERLAPKIAAFEGMLRNLEEVQEGDVVYLDYLPQSGTRLTVNGDVQSELIEGADFYAALLRSYLGERPADSKLKRALLGTGPE